MFPQYWNHQYLPCMILRQVLLYFCFLTSGCRLLNFMMHAYYESSYIWTKSKSYVRKSHEHSSKKKYKNHNGKKKNNNSLRSDMMSRSRTLIHLLAFTTCFFHSQATITTTFATGYCSSWAYYITSIGLNSSYSCFMQSEQCYNKYIFA